MVFRIGFALSILPHLHRAYLVRVSYSFSATFNVSYSQMVDGTFVASLCTSEESGEDDCSFNVNR